MVRPARFAFNEETAQNNCFQQPSGSVSVANKALDEFDAFVGLLRANDVDLTIIQDSPEPWTPDSIFPNNWFSSHITGELVLYPMFAMNRRKERKREVLDLLRRTMNHRKVVDLTAWEAEDEFLEGTGSMVLDRDRQLAYCCRSARTSEKVLAAFCSRMNFDAIRFDAVDAEGNAVYHTNVMMAVGTQLAVICLEAIRNVEERRKVESRLILSGKIVVEITLDQMNRFAGNMLEIKNRSGHPLMVMSASARNALAPDQERLISTFTRIVSTDLQTIETIGGGSARCMLAEIFC